MSTSAYCFASYPAHKRERESESERASESERGRCSTYTSTSCRLDDADTAALVAIAPVSDVPYPSMTDEPNTSQIQRFRFSEDGAPPTRTAVHRFPSNLFSFHFRTTWARTASLINVNVSPVAASPSLSTAPRGGGGRSCDSGVCCSPNLNVELLQAR